MIIENGMLFVAITKKKMAPSLVPMEERTIGDSVLSMCVDGQLARLESSHEQVQVAEYCNPRLGSSSCLASAVWNAESGTLTIRCPVVGGRPLYYCLDPVGQFYCSTHIRMIRAAGVPIRENREVLPEYFLYRCVMPPATLFEGIEQVPLGGSLCVTAQLGRLSLNSRPLELPVHDSHLRLPEVAQQIYDQLRTVLVNNVTTASRVLLSGGIDSSISMAIAKSDVGVNHSYSSVYPFEQESLNVERFNAESAGQMFGTHHRVFAPSTQRYQEAIVESIAAAEVPLHHLQSPLMYLLCKDCFQDSNEPVVNSIGAGGAFGNFRNFLYAQRRPGFRFLNHALGRALLGWTSRSMRRGRVLLASLQDAQRSFHPPRDYDALWQWHAYGDLGWIRQHLDADWQEVIAGPKHVLSSYFDSSREDVWALCSLLGDESATINIWSKLAESCGQTMLYPMYDDAVVQSTWRLSWDEKLAPPDNRLRRHLARMAGVPQAILDRPKSGFGVRRVDWATSDGPLEPLVRIAAKHVDPEWFADVRSTDRCKAMTCWNLINYGIWKRLIIIGESCEKLLEELDAERSASSSGSGG
jgi:asparagine synthetase B (glutamine-hydrolysing)